MRVKSVRIADASETIAGVVEPEIGIIEIQDCEGRFLVLRFQI